MIHSPLPGGATFLPWQISDPTPYATAGGYAVVALFVLGGGAPAYGLFFRPVLIASPKLGSVDG